MMTKEIFKYGQMMIQFNVIYCLDTDNEKGSVNNCVLLKHDDDRII